MKRWKRGVGILATVVTPVPATRVPKGRVVVWSSALEAFGDFVSGMNGICSTSIYSELYGVETHIAVVHYSTYVHLLYTLHV